jgi:DNA-binding MarR family transcriptional regulator
MISWTTYHRFAISFKFGTINLLDDGSPIDNDRTVRQAPRANTEMPSPTQPTEITDAECGMARSPIPRSTRGRTGFSLAKVGAIILEMADEALAETGLDGRSYCVLATLAVDGPDSQHELAALMGIAPGVMVAELDQLEAVGLVERNRDPKDRRRTRVTLTTKGDAALAAADAIADTVTADLLSGLSRSELTQLGELLSRGLHVDD